MVSHTMEMMLAALSVIWGGVVDRHPKLRIAFLESGGGWIAPWLDRMDRHFDDKGFNYFGRSMRPRELFERNCWISFEPVEKSIGVLADYIGPHKIRLATDYPDQDGFFPGARQMMRDRLGTLCRRSGISGGGRRRARFLRYELSGNIDHCSVLGVGCRSGEFQILCAGLSRPFGAIFP